MVSTCSGQFYIFKILSFFSDPKTSAQNRSRHRKIQRVFILRKKRLLTVYTRNPKIHAKTVGYTAPISAHFVFQTALLWLR